MPQRTKPLRDHNLRDSHLLRRDLVAHLERHDKGLHLRGKKSPAISS
jgi:hypothetical protein